MANPTEAEKNQHFFHHSNEPRVTHEQREWLRMNAPKVWARWNLYRDTLEVRSGYHARGMARDEDRVIVSYAAALLKAQITLEGYNRLKPFLPAYAHLDPK